MSSVAPPSSSDPAALGAHINKVWGKSTKDGANPIHTIHNLPEVAEDEYQQLCNALATRSGPKSSEGQAAEADQPRFIPDSSTQMPMITRRDGLAAHDYFNFGKTLGKGGMGVVLSASQESLSRSVAIKVLKEDDSYSSSQKAAFIREALITGALTHPNIVPLYLLGRDGQGRLFMVMKQVEGRSWGKMMRTAMPEKEGQSFARFPQGDLTLHLEIFLKVCDAVAFAHSNMIVHRDLKPENVMVGDYGEVTVMDWGLALDVSGRGRFGTPTEQASAVAGTPAYMAPEMAQGDLLRISTATDVYLMGAILYEIVTGRPPHLGRTIYDVLMHAGGGKVDPVKPRDGLPRGVNELERILRKAMNLEPGARYENIAALQADIRAFLAGQSDRNESEALANEARESLTALAQATVDLRVTSPFYPRCAEIVNKAQQALTLWGHNPRAMRVRQEAIALYADLALRNRDWGLAESLLRDLKLSGAGGGPLAQSLENRLRQYRGTMQRSDYLLRRSAKLTGVAVAALLVFVGVCVFLYMQLRRVETANEEQARQLGTEQEQLRNLRDAMQVQRKEVPRSQVPEKPIRPTVTPNAEGANFVDLNGAWVPPNRLDDRQVKLLGAQPGPDELFLLWDDQARIWTYLGTGGAAPEATPIQLPLERGVVSLRRFGNALAWSDLQNGAHVMRLSDRNVLDLPTVRDAVRALALWEQGDDLLVARCVGKKVQVFNGKGERGAEFTLAADSMEAAYNDKGELAVLTRTGIEFLGKEQRAEKFEGDEIAQGALQPNFKQGVLVMEGRPRDVLYLSWPGDKASLQGLYSFPQGNVTCCACAPRDGLIAAGSSQGEVVVLDAHAPISGRMHSYGQPFKGAVRNLAFSLGGERLMAIDENGAAHVWDISRPQRER